MSFVSIPLAPAYCYLIKFVLMDSQFLCICQQALLKSFSTLFKNQTKLETSTRKKQTTDFLITTWQQYTALNQTLVELCADISRSSAYWSPFLTVFIARLIAVLCYLAYITFFARTLSVFFRLIFCSLG